MAYCTINGLTVGIARSSPLRLKRAVKGRKRTATTGDVTEARRASKLGVELTTDPMLSNEAESLELFLLGKHHVWALDGATTSSGGAGMSTMAAADAFKWSFAAGAYSDTTNMTVASNATAAFLFDLAGLSPTGDFTVLANAKPNGEAAFEWYGIRSTGNAYRSGVLQGVGSYAWQTQTAAAFNILGKDNAGANAALLISSLVVIPWLVPAAQLAQLTTFTARRWGASPIHDVSGSMIPQTFMLMRGALTQSGHLRGNTGGAQRDNLRTVGFTLREA